MTFQEIQLFEAFVKTLTEQSEKRLELQGRQTIATEKISANLNFMADSQLLSLRIMYKLAQIPLGGKIDSRVRQAVEQIRNELEIFLDMQNNDL